jgi:ATP-binding protein involved in chromosome partitioning
MSDALRNPLLDLIESYVPPFATAPLGRLGGSVRIQAAEPAGVVHVALGFPAGRYGPELADALRQYCGSAADGVRFEVSWQVVSHAVQHNLKPLPGIKNIVAVASGKGGVGKSTTAVNLALALAAEGARVGILDADIYGPSQPQLLGVGGERPESHDEKTLEPLLAHGLQVMSIGFLIDAEQPMVWRGPMVTSALNQLLGQTNWQDLDYLVVDMPPGTGDIQLTLSQSVPVSGAVIVTTPQDLALLDARKGLKMFQKVNVSVLGVVENMATHICSACGHQEPIFGAGGGQRMADQYQVPLLGSLPLDIRIREEADSGVPTVVAAPDSDVARAYRTIALGLAAGLAAVGKDYSRLFPSISIEDS